MERKQYLRYAVFVAEQIIDIYGKKYPKDKRPKVAIKPARKVIKNDTAENRGAAGDAGDAMLEKILLHGISLLEG